MSSLDLEKIVEKITMNVKALESEIDCAIACVSGGIDSTVSAVIAKKALDRKVYPVFIDTGFMRLNEGTKVQKALSNLINLEIYDFSEEFISKIEGLSDAEEKRIVFRDCFYNAVKRIAYEKGCSWVVQGTIKADVVETTSGIKTQHNVLNRELLKKYGLRVIEPLINLYKHEVRAIAKYLGLPQWIIERQPFPGPGLLVRAVGRLYREKLELVRRLTDVIEERLSGRGFSQYFPAVWEYRILNSSIANGIEYTVFDVKTTGVIDGKRTYGYPIVVKAYPKTTDVYELYKNFDTSQYPHVLLELVNKGKGEYLVAIRIVKTENFIVAEVPRINISELIRISEEIALSVEEVKAVAFDVTPKPPATIEYE